MLDSKKLEKPNCRVSNCENPAKAKGYCTKHHQRWFRTGSTALKKEEEKYGNPHDPLTRVNVRNVDTLGRIALPKKIKPLFGKLPGKQLEFYVDYETQTIALREHQDGCFFCKSHIVLITLSEKRICSTCVRKLLGAMK